MKKVLVVALALFLAAGPALAADGAKVTGFADIYYTIADETADDPADSTAKNKNEGKFLADAEVNIVNTINDGVIVRLDIESDLAVNGGGSAGGDSARIEQAFFVLKDALGPVAVIAGVLNNPIGWEAEDAPDMFQYSHGLINDILDHQTVLNGNNIAGLALQGAVGPATITVALLDDTYLTSEENSIAAVLNVSPVKGLALEVGYVTQAAQDESGNNLSADLTADGTNDTLYLGAENVLDVNLTLTMVKGLTLGLEYLIADEVVDSALGVYVNYAINDKLSLTGRYDSVTWADLNYQNGATLVDVTIPAYADSSTTTVAVNYALAENLGAVLEYRTLDDKDRVLNTASIYNSLDEGSTTTLEFVAKF